MKKLLVIPARLESTRLPRKPLISINGKTVIQRTYERCIKAFDKELTYVATDSEEIVTHCENLGIQVIMTSDNCLTGTDRVAEVAEKLQADYYINVQGDEPLFDPEDIDSLNENIYNNANCILNGYSEIKDEQQYRDRNIPKVVFGPDNSLLYMSRSPIPGNKRNEFQKAWRQVCVYGFPRKALLEFKKFGQKTPLEDEEDIEILRFLELGYKVKMIKLSGNSIAVDVPKDLERVKERLNERA